MPAAQTFNGLIADLQSYLERGTNVDQTVFTQLPKLINNAEREIAQALKILGFINPVTSVLGAGVCVYPKPDRWRETVSMWYGAGSNQNSRTPIYPRSHEYVRRYWPDTTVTSPPEFYTDYDYAHWLIGPTPDLAYPWEILYYQLPALLDANNQTNWTTQYAPTTLLYRALLETAPFLKNDERIGTWQGLYQESLQGLDTENIRRIVDRSTERKEN